MELTDYKPGRRLDAMVAMALGWRWAFPKGRTLYPPDDSVELAAIDSPLIDYWDVYITEYNWSTNTGAAFEAALEAGVLQLRRIGQYEQSGVDFFEIDDGDVGILAIAETAAHCLCLGILAVQPEEKLAEFESWLEGVE